MVRFDKYDTLVRVLRRLLVGNVHFRDGFRWEEYFKTEKKALIVANHGPIIGPLVWVMAIFPRIVDLGFGHLTYSAIAHPLVLNIPLFAQVVGFEMKKDGKRLHTGDYVDLFNSGQLNVLSVAPEGEYSLYGNGIDVQPFRSYRSLEIALRGDCRIILVVAKGLERWQRNVSIEAGWRKRLLKSLALKIPFIDKLDQDALEEATQVSVSGIFGRIRDLYVASEIFEPELKAADLSEERTRRDEQLRIEGDRMRAQMIKMVEGLKAS
jgi:hypothetical protein